MSKSRSGHAYIEHAAERVKVTRLSPREADVAELVAQGYTNQRIAKRLGISENCVKLHMHHIFTKKNFQNRTQLALWASARIGSNDHDFYDR